MFIVVGWFLWNVHQQNEVSKSTTDNYENHNMPFRKNMQINRNLMLVNMDREYGCSMSQSKWTVGFENMFCLTMCDGWDYYF